jgi:hypothetical protein
VGLRVVLALVAPVLVLVGLVLVGLVALALAVQEALLPPGTD